MQLGIIGSLAGSTRDVEALIGGATGGVWRQFSRMQEAIMPSPVGLRGVLPPKCTEFLFIYKRDIIFFS